MLNFSPLEIPELLENVQAFPTEGSLAVSVNNLVYLKVDNAYIHQLFPLLQNRHNQAYKPDYFGEQAVGAHISVIYPEENIVIATQELAQKHTFKITGVFSADLGTKRYYVLGIQSASLIQLRKKYKLSEKLYFKNHWIDLHITLAKSLI